MHPTNEILSDIIVHTKYARYIKTEQRRETWEELVDRNMQMHLKKYPHIEELIRLAYSFVFKKQVLPSMRSLHFGGLPIELANNRIYNCSFLPADDVACFSELMFMLLGGTGGGYSVQSHHVEKLPEVKGIRDGWADVYTAEDSIEGWADCIKMLVESHFYGKPSVHFDLSQIREKGSELITTGGKAPGPEPLAACLNDINTRLTKAAGRKLTTLEVHDIICVIADAVLAGGIRRAALICLFDRTDKSMLECKQGEWWVDNAQRGRANNSAVLPRGEVTEEEFRTIMKACEDSGCGEPAVYWTNNIDWGTNPCCEIGLRPFQFCNLCEVSATDVISQDDFNLRCIAAAVIGTLQAGYTDFHYLRPIWKETTEEEALIGVGITGIGSGKLNNINLEQGAAHVVRTNKLLAKKIGINPSARCTTVKPSGTSSLVLGSSSGIHAWHNDFYIRRVRLGKNEALYQYLAENAPSLIEDDLSNSKQAVASFPQAAPDYAILRNESMSDMLERVRRFNTEWVGAGHITGDNRHNVSVTVSVKDDEWKELVDWMWLNRNTYNGISVLPYSGGTYQQAPFEDISEEKFNELYVGNFDSIDLTQVKEAEDNTNLQGEAACAGGVCELNI